MKSVAEDINKDFLLESLDVTSYKCLALRFLKKNFQKQFTSPVDINKFLSSYGYSIPFNGTLIGNEEEYYKKLLGLNTLPIEVFLEEYDRVHGEIKKLNANIDYCKQELESLNSKQLQKGFLEGDDLYYKYKCEYFKKKNEEIKDRKIQFLLLELKERSVDFALSPESKLNFFLFKSFQYDFWDLKKYSPINNKFLNAEFSYVLEMQELYKNKTLSFNQKVKSYIKQNDIIKTIQKWKTSNHILSKRKKSLTKITKAYIKQDYFLFGNLVPLFIEGIFADICIELGFTDKQLHHSSLNKKLEYINEKIEFFPLYEYFAFDFPVVRNKVAHGDLSQQVSDVDNDMLLLDLFSVLDFCVTSEYLPHNLFRKKITSIQSTDDFFDKYINNPKHFDDIQLDDIYKETTKLKSYINKTQTKKFLKFIEKKSTELNKEKINNILSHLQKKRVLSKETASLRAKINTQK